MESPSSSKLPRNLEVSMSSLVSEPMLDIDSATLELSLPDDTARPVIQHIDSCNSIDWEKLESFNDHDSVTDSLFGNNVFSQHTDLPYLSDVTSFQETSIDDYPSEISKDDHLAQLVKNAKSKNMVPGLESVSSAKENVDFYQSSNDTKMSLNLSANDDEPPCFNACKQTTINVDGNDANPSEGNVQPLQAHPEYTENFHNYKLCRVVAPGVKECLILETGEQIKCDKRKKLKEAEEKLAKSISKVENSLLPSLPPPPPHPQSPPPPLSSSPDITDHSAPTTTTIKQDSDCLNKSQTSLSSDKENCDVSPSPQPREEDKEAENGSWHSPLRQKQVTVYSGDESGADFFGQEKLSKKVFKITKPHVEDSAVYFGNLRLGRGINKGCPRSFILGSCLKNKMSMETNRKLKGDKKPEDTKENRDPAANVDHTTDAEEPTSPVEPLTLKTPLISSWKDFNLNDVNSLSPTGYYSDPCQTKGTSWNQRLELSPVDVGKSSEELCRQDRRQHSLAGKEWCRTIANKRDSLSPQRTEIPQVVTQINASDADGCKLTPSESGPVPNFKSLQERQVTWMLHQLEEQHLQSMKQQYEQHQRNIQRIQEDMEAEILNQQASFEEQIKTKKNALIKEAFGPSRSPNMFLHPNRSHPNFNSYDADIDLSDSEESEDDMSPGIVSRNELNRFAVAPTDKHQSQESETSSKLSPVSPRREPFSVLTHRLDSSGLDPGLITDGRVLQGGVYATPFPLSKSTLLLKSAPVVMEKCGKPPSLDTNASFSSVLGEELKSEAALLQELEQRHNQRMQQRQLSPGRNFDQLSDDQLTDILNDSQGNLREKHAKHLSDLRLYYEKEIKELRDALRNTESVSNRNSFKKLVEENLLLTKKCQDKEEQLSKQKARDYEEQIRTYQSQLKTYSQRCTELEKLLNDFKHQLYQETAHNHRKEARLKDLETDLLKKSKAVEEMVKLRDQFLEDNELKQATIQKLVSRYEKLEKEYNIIKESLSVAEERYFEANAEILYVKRENARLDFDNKRFMRENENLRQKIGSFKFYGDEESGSLNNATVNNSASKSLRSSQRNLSSQTRLEAERDLMKEVSGKEILEAFENQFTSPIMAAERELRKLRSTSKKFSGKTTNSVTDIDHLPEGIFVDLPLSITSRTKAKTNQRQFTKDVKSKSNSSTSHHSAIETTKLIGKSKVPLQAKEVNNSARCDIRLNDVSNSLVKDLQQPMSLQQDKSNNAGSLDKLLESKPSQMSFQPQIDDLFSSLTKVQNQLESSPISKTQQKFQVTLDTIKKLENRYDGLQAEKVQLEAALSRVPMSGRVDRKARQKKEDLEKKLDAIERELGSVRMSLKKFNVLKSSI